MEHHSSDEGIGARVEQWELSGWYANLLTTVGFNESILYDHMIPIYWGNIVSHGPNSYMLGGE
jgi:hypothetical protein